MKTFLLAFCILAASLVATTVVAAPDPMDGSWTPVKAELGGQPMPDAVLQTVSLALAAGKYEVSVAGEVDKGTYTTDASTRPPSMTVTGTDGPNKGKTFPCIYELQGDTLRVCYDLSGAQRPAEFKTAAGTMQYLVTYQRKK